MTLPYERFRSLRWAREWLGEIALDPLVSKQTQAQATTLLQAYPSDQLFRSLIESRAPGLEPKDHDALNAALNWIWSFHGPISDRMSLTYVQRHLPVAGQLPLAPSALEIEMFRAGGVMHDGIDSLIWPDED